LALSDNHGFLIKSRVAKKPQVRILSGTINTSWR
jgi:hypothetical protein